MKDLFWSKQYHGISLPLLTLLDQEINTVVLIWQVILLMVQKSGDHQLLCKIYHDLPGFITIPGGCLGFLPSTVYPHFSSFWLNFILMSMNLPPAPKEWWFWKRNPPQIGLYFGEIVCYLNQLFTPRNLGENQHVGRECCSKLMTHTITNVISSPFLYRSENRWRNSQKVAW